MLPRRLTLRDELMLAVLPTAMILVVIGLVDVLSEQRLLFASLAASAFLIYVDPHHGMNQVRTLVVAQMMAALLGFVFHELIGPGYLAAGVAVVVTITAMIVIGAMHPPAVATSLSFALRAGEQENLVIFALAVGMTAALVGMQKAMVWMVARALRRRAGSQVV